MRFRHTLISSVICASLGTVAAQAGQPLPNLIARAPQGESVPAASGLQKLSADRESSPFAAQTKLALSKGLVSSASDIHFDETTGMPTFIWAGNGAKKASVGALKLGEQSGAAAKAYLRDYASLLKLDATSLSGAELVHTHKSEAGPAIARFVQRVDGIEVFGSQLNVLMRDDMSLVAVSGQFSPNVLVAEKSARAKGQQKVSAGQFAMAPESAVYAVSQDVGAKRMPSLTHSADRGDYVHWLADTKGDDVGVRGEVRTKQVLYSVGDALIPSYYVETWVEGGDSDNLGYAHVVDSRNGKVLFRKSLTENDGFAYRVFADAEGYPWDGPNGRDGNPFPLSAVGNYKPSMKPNQVATLAHGNISTKDPWLTPNARETRGNNVDAFVDLDAGNGFTPASRDFRAGVNKVVGGAYAFDYAYDATKPSNISVTQQMAAVTHLFYMNNWLHDDFYDAGFNETSGNAQQSNYGRGGVEFDPISAEGQDYSGTNNANMSTPADGAPPRMQMYNWLVTGDAKLSYVAGGATTTITNVRAAAFGPAIYNIASKDVVRYDDGVGVGTSGLTGTTADDACEPAANAAALAGKIALIQRGTCAFVLKVKNAQNAGAAGVIVYNHSTADTPGMGGSDATIIIPSLGITNADGLTLVDKVNGGPVTASIAMQPGRDSTVDSLIIAHEWGHYISNRLVGNSSGLINNQGRSMGEGWGDFHALLTTIEEADAKVASNLNFGGTYQAGAYSVYSPFTPEPDTSFYYGIRRFPYTVDMTKNALTFKHIANGVTLPGGGSGAINSEVHNSGEIWANALLECYVSLLRDTPRLSFADARKRMKEYLVAGYKLTPVAPTYTEARDAVLAVAKAKDAKDYELFLKAFAKRGMGGGAVSPPRMSSDHIGVKESFTTGAGVVQTSASWNLRYTPYWCDDDGALDVGETALLTVKVRNNGFKPIAKLDVTATTKGKATFSNGGKLSLTDIAAGAEKTFTFEVKLDAAGTRESFLVDLAYASADLLDEKGVALEVKGVSPAIDVNYDLEGNSTKDDVSKGVSDWKYNVLTGSPVNGWLVSKVNLPGIPANNFMHVGVNEDVPADYANESPEFVVGSDDKLVVKWKQFFSFEAPNWDGGVVEYQVAGGAWVDAGAALAPAYNGTLVATPGTLQPLAGRKAYVSVSSSPMAAMTPATLDLSGKGLAGKKVKVRFRIGTDDNSFALGWLIDDVDVTGISNKPFTTIVANKGICKNRTPSVTVPVDTAVLMGETVSLTGGGTDPDGDALTYKWEVSAGVPQTLTGAETPTVTFVATGPVTSQFSTLRLTVTDPHGFKASKDVTVRITQRIEHSESGGGGGALGWALLLAPLALLRRRRKTH